MDRDRDIPTAIPSQSDYNGRTMEKRNPYLKIRATPKLRNPLLIAAFHGWNDAGGSASLAMSHLINQWEPKILGAVDQEEFFDFTVARPAVQVNDSEIQMFQWPQNDFFYHVREDAENDVILLLGVEPHLRWRTFVGCVEKIYQRFGCSRLVTLGSFAIPITHRRIPDLFAMSTDTDLRGRLTALGAKEPSYQGPTGIVGVLHHMWQQTGKPATGLWAGLPGYLPDLVNPSGSLVILRTLDRLFALAPQLADLIEADKGFREKVEEAMNANPKIKSWVDELEEQLEVGGLGMEAAQPPDDGGRFVRDVEEFLRSKRERGEDEPAY